MKNRVNGFLCEKNGLTGNQTGTTKFDHVEEKEKCFDSAFYPFRIVLSLFVSSTSRFYIGEVIPLNFPITSLRVSPKHVITRGHAHIKRTAGVASSSSHHHHHHAHVCGELCQNAVLDVKSKCASPSSRETTTFLDDDGHEERQKQQQQYYGETRVDFNRPSLR
jgi:hypothetical protein